MDQEISSSPKETTLSSDILYGAVGIAKYLYGHAKHRRKVYNLIETEKLPHFRLGAMICARRSILMQWITKQENECE